MTISEKERNALDELRSHLSERFGILEFKIFGSKVHNNVNPPGSDVDVMIVLPDSSPTIESEIDDIIFDINIKYDCLISAVFYTKKEIESGPIADSPLYKRIVQEGVTL